VRSLSRSKLAVAALAVLAVAGGCAGGDAAAGGDGAQAFLQPAEVGAAGDAAHAHEHGPPAATGHDQGIVPAGADHAHLGGAAAAGGDHHGAAEGIDHAHLISATGGQPHARATPDPAEEAVPDAAGSDLLTEAQRRIRDSLGPAAAGPEPGPAAIQSGPADAVPSAAGGRAGEVHVHDDGFAHTHGAGAPVTWTVRYTADGGFAPKRLDIRTGDEVVFVNESAVPVWPASNIHPTHEILPEFDPLGAVAPGESWAFRFLRNGYWRYHNHIDAAEAGLIVSSGGPEEDLEPLNVASPDVSFSPVPAGGGGEELLSDAAALESFVLAHGPAEAVRELKALELATGRDCHSAAHKIGHVSYERFGAAAYTLAAHDCHSGVLHGIIEALIADRGTTRLAADVAALCSAAGNAFRVHQCYHGVGHGLLAWTTYELPEALDLCDLMPAYADRDACYGGVHMENGVGGLSGLMGHTTEYLDAARPHFPCDILPERHVPGCYFWQTSNLFWFGYEAPEVARLCYEAPAYAQESCWWSMGRDLGSIHRDSPAAAAELCGAAPSTEHLTDCFQGAALSRFTEAANAGFSAELCAIADADHPPEVAEGCWQMVLRDAPHILGDAAAKRSFCQSIAPGTRRDRCREALFA